MTKSRRIIAILVIVAIAITLLFWAFAPRPAPVEMATATIGYFERTIDEDGRTRVRDRYTISAPLVGRLARITLREGDAVATNAVVATLLPLLSPMLDARTLQELSARVEVADAMLARADARIRSTRVALDQAQNELKRSEQLAPKNYVALTKLESDRLALIAAQREQDVAREERDVALHELEQARAALSTISGSAHNVPQHASGDSIFDITTPIKGTVLRVLQPSETTVTLGTPLLEIGDTRNLEIVSELLTADALQALPGTLVRIERWGGLTPLEGRVRRVEPAAFTKVSALGVEEQRVNVLIDITSPVEQWQTLGDGYHVSVRIVAQAEHNVLQVPVSAVFPRDDSDTANAMATFTVRDGHAKLTPVSIGARNGREAWILDGLKSGDWVIIYPGNAIQDGIAVVPRSSMRE